MSVSLGFLRSVPTWRKAVGEGPETVFLHIGKTGGTALREVLAADAVRAGKPRHVLMQHDKTLKDVLAEYPAASVGWFVRDPVDRFVSGYLSRQRKGRPRYDVEWTRQERRAFEDFPTIGSLIEGIASGHRRARRAVEAVFHAGRGLAHFLHSPEVLVRNQKAIAFIGTTEAMDDEISRLKGALGIDPEIDAPTDPLKAHRNPNPGAARISNDERRVLKSFLAPDYAVYEWCLAQRQTMLARTV